MQKSRFIYLFNIPFDERNSKNRDRPGGHDSATLEGICFRPRGRKFSKKRFKREKRREQKRIARQELLEYQKEVLNDQMYEDWVEQIPYEDRVYYEEWINHGFYDAEIADDLNMWEPDDWWYDYDDQWYGIETKDERPLGDRAIQVIIQFVLSHQFDTLPQHMQDEFHKIVMEFYEVPV